MFVDYIFFNKKEEKSSYLFVKFTTKGMEKTCDQSENFCTVQY